MRLYNPIIAKGRDLTASDRALIVSPAHDREDRSACMLWESLFEAPGCHVPKALYTFLNADPAFPDIQYTGIIPEHHTAFDNLGKGRMHDLVVMAESGGQKLLFAIEAKVDEPFDNRTIKAYGDEGIARRQAGKNSNKPARIRKLLDAVLPASQHDFASGIKYQLLQVTAGTLAEAKICGAQKAIFCVLNFEPKRPHKLYGDRIKSNAKDFDDFLHIFTSGTLAHLPYDLLSGPFYAPGDSEIPADMPLYFLKLKQSYTS